MENHFLLKFGHENKFCHLVQPIVQKIDGVSCFPVILLPQMLVRDKGGAMNSGCVKFSWIDFWLAGILTADAIPWQSALLIMYCLRFMEC